MDPLKLARKLRSKARLNPTEASTRKEIETED